MSKKTELLRREIQQWRGNATATHRSQLRYGFDEAVLCREYYTIHPSTRCVGCPIAEVHEPECGHLWDLSNEAEWAVDDWWGDFEDPLYDYKARMASTKLAEALEDTLRLYEKAQETNHD